MANKRPVQMSSSPDEQQVFVEDLHHDEMRSGFLVISNRKKLWNIQIGLVSEFARICKKHDLRWFVAYGTLLGAARHKGFIPWDDDVDVVMFRPDYEKFKQVAPSELKEPYFFDNWYEYRLESEEKFPDNLDPNLQWITLEQESRFPPTSHLTQWPSIRLRDSRTTFIESWYADRKYVHQGIFIDVFPLDPVPPFDDNQQMLIFEAMRQLLLATAYPRLIRESIRRNQNFIFPREELEKFLSLPYRERGSNLEKFQLKNYFQSSHIGMLIKHIRNEPSSYRTSDFDNVTYLPFEKIEVPVPFNYDNVLKAQYGDWHKMVFTHSHAQTYSTDISYDEYFKSSIV